MNVIQQKMMERYRLEQKLEKVKNDEEQLYRFMNEYTDAWFEEINSIPWYHDFHQKIVKCYEEVAMKVG